MTTHPPRLQRTEAEIQASLTTNRRLARAREKLEFCKAYALHQGAKHSSPETAAHWAIRMWDTLMEDPEIKELIG